MKFYKLELYEFNECIIILLTSKLIIYFEFK